MRLDVRLDAPVERAADRARELTGCGVSGLFTFEGPHDVFLPLALAAGAVETDLMTNIAVAMPRSPVHLAHAAYDLHRLSGGRFRLGLGSQTRAHVERRYGAQWSAPAARMREIVAATRAVLHSWQYGRPLDFTGTHTRHTLMPPMFDPGPNPHGIPEVCLGALGPVMTRTAAEVADGLLVMPFNSAEHFRERTLPAIADGLERSGRTPQDLAVYPQAIVAMGRTRDEQQAAAQGVRALLAFYSATPAYRPVLEVHGWAQIQRRLHTLARDGAQEAMAELITDEMVDVLAVVGTPEECAARIRGRFAAHAERVCAYFPGYPVADQHIADLARTLRTPGSGPRPAEYA